MLSLGTPQVQVHVGQVFSESVIFIDTPGFGDKRCDNSDVLRSVAELLSRCHLAGAKLRGIVYLHPITDTPLRESSKRNLKLVRKLCGDFWLRDVVLATTMWEAIEPSDGWKREDDLHSDDDVWDGMVKHGSRVRRYANDLWSAGAIVRECLGNREPVELRIQVEMAQGKRLNETDAGRELLETLEAEAETVRAKLQVTAWELAHPDR